MGINVKVQIDPKKIIDKMNIKRTRLAVANEMLKDFTRFVPLQTSALSKNVEIAQTDDITQIVYKSEYAHYMWAGILFLAANGSSWARQGERKFPTNIPLNYQGGRGARWTETAEALNYDKWVRIAEEFIKRGL